MPTLTRLAWLMQVCSIRFCSIAGIHFNLAPVISSFPSTLDPAGEVLTVSGSNFGSSVADIYITVGGVSCTPNALLPVDSKEHIRVTCPPNYGASVAVSLSVGPAGQAQSTSTTSGYGAPTITSISPSTIPTQGADITISGNYFGSFAENATVTITTTPSTTCGISSLTGTSIVCSVPRGFGTNYDVRVDIADQHVVSTAALGYECMYWGVFSIFC